MAHPARSTYGSFPPHSARNGSNSGTRAKGPTFFKSGTFTFGRIPAVPLSVVERPLFAPTRPTLFASLMGSRGSGETRKSSAAGKDRTLSAYDGFVACGLTRPEPRSWSSQGSDQILPLDIPRCTSQKRKYLSRCGPSPSQDPSSRTASDISTPQVPRKDDRLRRGLESPAHLQRGACLPLVEAHAGDGRPDL